MNFLDVIFSAWGRNSSGSSGSGISEQAQLQFERSNLISEIRSKISETSPYAIKADDSYMELKYNNLNNVPAVLVYDGNYQDKLSELMNSAIAEANSAESVATIQSTKQSFESELTSVATQIQTYLREDTSSLEAAKLWDAKNVKATIEHFTYHFKKDQMPDDPIMASVMEAFRRFAEIGMAGASSFGSQNLINATYEAVIDGQDAFSYMQQIIDLDSIARFGEEGLNENADVIVPNAGLFGGLLF